MGGFRFREVGSGGLYGLLAVDIPSVVRIIPHVPPGDVILLPPYLTPHGNADPRQLVFEKAAVCRVPHFGHDRRLFQLSS